MITRTLQPGELVEKLLAEPGDRRRLVAVAGAPGAGKSTFADWLGAALDSRRSGCSAVVSMDGFHYDDIVLEARGDRARKGAPHTFDTGGLLSMLGRLAADDGADVAVPVFDRAIEIARAGARIVGPEARIVVVEGNYLLLDDPGWAPLRDHFDMTVMIDVPEPVLKQRLTRRWTGLGLTGEALEQKLSGNDLPNMRLVLERSRPADIRVVQGA